MKIPLLPNNVGKKSAFDVVPKQGHDTLIKLVNLIPIKCAIKMKKKVFLA